MDIKEVDFIQKTTNTSCDECDEPATVDASSKETSMFFCATHFAAFTKMLNDFNNR